MSEKKDEPLSAATASVALVGELMKAAGNDPNVKEAAGNLGKAALTLSRTINNALLPLAAVNFAFEKARAYFEGSFQADIAKKAENIPPENIQEPKASVAGPALQALAFTHEEASLKNMFLELLATAMDSRKAEFAHPAFVEIIKQLDSTEAPQLLNLLKAKGYIEVVSINVEASNGDGKRTLLRHLVDMRNTATQQPVRIPRFPVMLDNWARLGLIEVRYDAWLPGPNAYRWVESRPEFVELRQKHGSQILPSASRKESLAVQI